MGGLWADSGTAECCTSREAPQIKQEAEKRKKMAERKDYYRILGVTVSADQRDIKQARLPPPPPKSRTGAQGTLAWVH